MEKEKGITLIALIITIILMLILAGVVVSLTLGENGLFKTASGAAQKYKIEEVREKVEMALVEYNTGKIINGEEGEVVDALKFLLKNNTFEDIEIEDNIGIIDDYEITLTKENGKVIIENINQITGTLRLRCKVSAKEYTKDSVIINVKATGNVSKVIKPDKTEESTTNGKVEINYKVNKNGTYLFIAEDIEKNKIEKEIIIDKIDMLQPKNFTIEAQNITETGFTIKAETEDEQATEDNACSGIDKYEYYVKSSKEEEYAKYTTNVITGLKSGQYNVYVIAYDKAGNTTQSEEIKVNIVVKTYLYKSGDMCNELTGGFLGKVQTGQTRHRRNCARWRC